MVAYTLENMGNSIKGRRRDAGGSLKRNIERSYGAPTGLQASLGRYKSGQINEGIRPSTSIKGRQSLLESR